MPAGMLVINRYKEATRVRREREGSLEPGSNPAPAPPPLSDHANFASNRRDGRVDGQGHPGPCARAALAYNSASKTARPEGLP